MTQRKNWITNILSVLSYNKFLRCETKYNGKRESEVLFTY